MTSVITPEALYFGAPPTLTVNSVDVGATLNNPKVGWEITKYQPKFKNAGGPVKGAVAIVGVVPTLEVLLNELSAAKVAHALPGSSQSVGTAAETGGGADTTLAAD